MYKEPRNNFQPTLRYVAREAKVSPTTVSLALEDKPTSRVSLHTRQRILKIANRLKYRPNYAARTLATRRSHAVGLIVPTLFNPIYAELAQELIDRATQVGYGVFTCSASGQEEEQRRAMEDLLNRGVDGLIVCSSLRKCSVIHELNEQGVPLVLAVRSVETMPGRSQVDFLGIDNKLGGFRATAHLIRLGHKRIGLLCGPQETSTGYDRLAGAQEAFDAYGLELDPGLVVVGDYYRKNG